MKDLHNAFVNTTAHVTQMMNVFDITERLVAEAKSFDVTDGLVDETRSKSWREEHHAS